MPATTYATPTHQTEPLYFSSSFHRLPIAFLATMNRGPGGVYAVPGLKNANSVKDCEECGKSFSIFRPKYHCRNCGKLALPLTHCTLSKNANLGNVTLRIDPLFDFVLSVTGSVICANCSESKNDLPKFGYTKYDKLQLLVNEFAHI